MEDVKLTKEQEILFEVYDKGVQNEDCDLDAYIEKMKQALSIANVTCRFLFIYVDGDYKLIQYVEAKNQEEAESKMEEGWARIVELEEDMQVVYNGR